MKAKTPRPIMVSYCCPDMVMSDFCFSLAHLVTFSVESGLHIGLHDQRTTSIEVGRTMQAVNAIRHGASHVLCLDSDLRS